MSEDDPKLSRRDWLKAASLAGLGLTRIGFSNAHEDEQESEKMRRHCVIMESCCYDYSEMMVLNMVRAGLFGELVHGECAYNHDLREVLFENANEGLWRRRHHTLRDSNLYPTHGLGPMAHYMNINRGDRFDYMISMSSSQRGLEAYRQDHVPSGDPQWKEAY